MIRPDDNNGNGHAWTLALAYQFNPMWQLRLEHIRFSSVQHNRQQWQWPIQEQQANTQLILRWRWQLFNQNDVEVLDLEVTKALAGLARPDSQQEAGYGAE